MNRKLFLPALPVGQCQRSDQHVGRNGTTRLQARSLAANSVVAYPNTSVAAKLAERALGFRGAFAKTSALLLRGLLVCLSPWSTLPGAAGTPLDPLLEPPVINTRPGPEYQDNTRAGAMIIGMDHTPQGRIWGCWTGTGDNHESYFILATSDDGGTSWSKPRVVIDPQEIPGKPPRYSLIGNLWTDPTGRLWLFFDQHMRGHPQTDWYITCDNPDADDPVWSPPVYFADGSTLNKPTILRSGEWLLPVSLLSRGRVDPARPDDPARQPGAHVYVSTDRGRTWQRRGGVKIPDEDTNHNEHMIVELRDGRLWMLLRTRYGIAESHSPDAGRTWSEPRKSVIENPSTRFFLRRLASGRLLLVKNGPIGERLRGRTHLTAFLSDDDGKSWNRGLLLDDRNALSYPDGFQWPDGRISILYDWNRHTDAEILLATFREEDVHAGRVVSADARVRYVVDKARAPNLSASRLPDQRRKPQTTADAKLDQTSVAYDGTAANQAVSAAQLRRLADGSWILLLRIGNAPGEKALHGNHLMRSPDQGKTWTAPAPFDVGLPREGDAVVQGPIELLVHERGVGLFFSTHAEDWRGRWHSWLRQGDSAFSSWQRPRALPEPLGARTFIRNSLVTRDGRLVVPFQHYAPGDESLSDGTIRG